ncbi:MAG: magnesium transporter [Bacilli bacterium]
MIYNNLVDFVEDLPANLIKKISGVTGKDDINRRVTVNAFLHFEKDTAGSIMTTEFVEIKSGATVKEAIAKIKKVGRDAETIDTTFVIDSSRHLIGTLNLDELIFAEEDTIVDTMDDDYVSTVTSTDQEEIGELFKKYDLHVMPVVNKDHRLIGIITIDDIMDVMEDEATEDIQKMAGTSPIDTPYLKTSVLKIAKSRIVWLLVLMISATFTSLIINKFESVLSVVPVLSVFIPMLMDTSGNAGNQTTTTITRALGIGDVDTSDYFKILFKEFRVSLITGFIVALFNFLWIFIELKTGIISNSTDGLPEWRIALQVAITLYIVIIFAKCLRCFLTYSR